MKIPMFFSLVVLGVFLVQPVNACGLFENKTEPRQDGSSQAENCSDPESKDAPGIVALLNKGESKEQFWTSSAPYAVVPDNYQFDSQRVEKFKGQLRH